MLKPHLWKGRNMAARSDWRGGISFAGQTIPVAAYKAVSRQRPPSFNMLDPTHRQRVRQQLVDVEGEPVERSETLRGVEVGKTIYPLPAEALELIEKVGRSDVLDIERFSEVGSVPLGLSLETYRIVPDEKVPGSASSVQTLWNGLRYTGRAAVIPNWSARAGSRPSTLVIHADDEGLVGNVLPFAEEIRHDAPAFEPVTDERQGQMFESGLEIFECSLDAFDLQAYADTWLARRQAAIDMAVAGKPIPVEVAADAPMTAPDLNAALAAALEKRKGAKKPAAKRPRAKAAA
jgi:non-homologous end joining protein Ku